jgi:polyisoprenoid-binding protein YceI
MIHDQRARCRAPRTREDKDMTQETWKIDGTHSGIHFSVRHMVIAKVRGQFSRWQGTLFVPDGDFRRATVDVTIDAASIDTGVADRDKHLRSADFFDVETYPEIAFKSRQVEDLGGDTLRLVGELTMHGVTREATLEVESAGQAKDPWGNTRAGFAARGSVDRKDFGLTWNQALEAGGVLVGEKVEIEIEVEAVLQAQEEVA